MRILHITTFLQGGAGRIITALAVAQRRMGHDVRVVADAGGEPGYATYPEYRQALACAGIALVDVRSTFKRDLDLNRAAARDVRRLTTSWVPDLVHAHAATPSRVVRLAGLCGPQGCALLVHTMHGWGTAKTAEQAASDLDTLQQADVLTTPSHASSASLRDMGLRRDIVVIPYGLPDLDPRLSADEADVALMRSRAPRVVLCVGTLCERKNQRLLVDALACDVLRDAAAVFIGDGDAMPITTRAQARGISDRVVVLGPREHASRYVPHADTLVLPSRNEGLPIAVLEALRAGVPVAGSNLPEITEALGLELSRFLCRIDDGRALAHAIRAALDVSDRRTLTERLKQRFAHAFTEDRMIAAYAQLYVAPNRIAS